MRYFKSINILILLIDLSTILGILFFILAPNNLIIIPAKTLGLLSLGYHFFDPLPYPLIVITLFLLIHCTLISPLPLTGILSLVIVHHYIKNTFLPAHHKTKTQFLGFPPLNSSRFTCTHLFSSYMPKLSVLLSLQDDPFNGNIDSFSL